MWHDGEFLLLRSFSTANDSDEMEVRLDSPVISFQAARFSFSGLAYFGQFDGEVRSGNAHDGGNHLWDRNGEISDTDWVRKHSCTNDPSTSPGTRP